MKKSKIKNFYVDFNINVLYQSFVEKERKKLYFAIFTIKWYILWDFVSKKSPHPEDKGFKIILFDQIQLYNHH